MLVLIGHVHAEPLPEPKVGQCPSGYRESEGYSAPLNDRAPAAEDRQLPFRRDAERRLLHRRSTALTWPCRLEISTYIGD